LIFVAFFKREVDGCLLTDPGAGVVSLDALREERIDGDV
jgi:hypothetical protein